MPPQPRPRKQGVRGWWASELSAAAGGVRAPTLASSPRLHHHALVFAPEELDNVVWYALRGPLARFALGNGPARRFAPEVAPFAGLPDEPGADAWSALRELTGPGGVVALFRAAIRLPAGWEVAMRMPCLQLTCPRLASKPGGAGIEVLGADDRDAMLALTAATRPGPFGARTPEIGLYIGVRSAGRLIAMAGERLRVDGATEISAVCTEPAHQRRGLAAALVTELVGRIQARGELPFLHVAEDNLGALRVYEALGFTQRARIAAIVVRAPA